jgi:DNA polymerase alpha subunit A
LFGKIYNEQEKRYVSCTVTVKNMVRCTFIAPRPFILDEDGNETSIYVILSYLSFIFDHQAAVPTREDINKELEATRQNLNIKKWMTKVVKRIYCFDGHPDVPRGFSEFIKAKYPATCMFDVLPQPQLIMLAQLPHFLVTYRVRPSPIFLAHIRAC